MKLLMDQLLEISKQRVRAQFIIGSKTVEALYSFVLGYALATMHAGIDDQRYKTFHQWLIDRGDAPQDRGWPGKMLGDAKGDSRLAMELFLDRVEQFAKEGR